MRNINVYILGNLNDAMTGDELERALDAYREAENQLACFGYGVLSPHHLPADLRGIKGTMIRAAMIQAADYCLVLDDGRPMWDLELANQFDTVQVPMESLYTPRGVLRSLMGVEKIEAADQPEA